MALIIESGYDIAVSPMGSRLERNLFTSAMIMSQSSMYSFLVLVMRVHIRRTKTTSAIGKRMETGMIYNLELLEFGSVSGAASMMPFVLVRFF